MKKTKVICTMGPRTDDKEVMRGLVRCGMDVARFNFSHGNYEEHRRRMDMLKQMRAEEGANVAILLDTKGPEIRTGVLQDGRKVVLEPGATFVLSAEDVVGTKEKVSITYPGLVQDIEKGKDRKSTRLNSSH